MSKLLEVYKKIPAGPRAWLKQGYSLIPLSWRLGPRFFRDLRFFEHSQWWPPERLRDYQNQCLHALIEHAYEQVPYYRELMDSKGLTPAHFQTVDDLSKLPILKKETVRADSEKFRARNFDDSQVVKVSTSGTTGEPLHMVFDRRQEYLNYDPYIWRFFGWGGHTPGQPRATLSRWTVHGRLPYQFNPVRSQLQLSAYDLNVNTAVEYRKAMKQYRIEYMDGYPASIELLTKYLKSQNRQPPVQLKAIFTHSECLFPWMRRVIEEYWGCKCFDWYGLEERAVLGVECDHHEGLHLCPDFGVTEFVADSDGQKRIIATGFLNVAMPLIRYDTEDFGELVDGGCSCGRKGFPLFRLVGGRQRIFALGKDGTRIPLTNFDVDHAVDHILQLQFIQNQPGELHLLLVRAPDFNERDIITIRRNLEERFRDNMDLQIHFTDQIERNPSGKTSIFIQNIGRVTE